MSAMSQAPVIDARDLRCTYWIKSGLLGRSLPLRAVNGVSLSIAAGKTLAVVGESGSGKSTLARLVTMIEKPTDGSLLIDGRDPYAATKAEWRVVRRAVQMVFQDPYGSLNPRRKVGAIIGEPLAINTDLSRAARRARVLEMIEAVGLRPEHVERYPHMFSGGQRQRIAIARALVLNPRLVVADKPVSALDISIQAQVLNLMMDLQQRFNLAYLFVSHDLSVVRHIADEVLVLYLGRPVEQGDKALLFARPRHPYTMALQAATPRVARRTEAPPPPSTIVRGEIASPLHPPSGCAFRTRCPYATDQCRVQEPELRWVDGRQVACHYAETLA